LKTKLAFLILSLFVALESGVSAKETNDNVEAQVQALLAQMSLEEKVGQMTQIDFSVVSVVNGEVADNPIDQAKLEDAILNRHIGSILNTPTTPNNQTQPIEKWRRMTQAIRDVAAKSRLKIPVLYGIDRFMVQLTPKTQCCFRKPSAWRRRLIPIWLSRKAK